MRNAGRCSGWRRRQRRQAKALAAGGAKHGLKKCKFPAGVLSREQVQAMAPPGCYVWNSRAQGNWQARPEGHPRKSRAWAIAGEEEACKFVMRHVWTFWLSDDGLAEAQCPIAGLLG